MLLKKAQRSNDLLRLATIVANDMFGLSFANHLSHLEGEEVFGSSKRSTNCPPNIDNDSQCPNHVNFSRPQVTIPTVEHIVDHVPMQQLPSSSNKLLPLVF